MRYTMLGKTGLRVSQACLGAMIFGAEPGTGPSAETSARIIDGFLEAGGNFIDTADKYTGGRSEAILGAHLHGRREQVVLATKYTLQTRPGDVNSAGNHRKNLVTSLEASLRRLRTDHIDLYWVHARDTLTPVGEVMRALDDQVRAGKILYVGVSDWPAWEISQANTLAELRGWSPFVGLQIHYNLIDRTVERELLPMARAFDLGVTAWGPLAGGLLTGKYLRGGTGRLSSGGGPGGGDERAAGIVGALVTVAEETGRTPAQVALAWLRSRPGVIIPIIGASTPEQLDDNLGGLDLDLAPEHRTRLNEVGRIEAGFPYDFLRGTAARAVTYGDQWDKVDDRRSTVGRAVADDLY